MIEKIGAVKNPLTIVAMFAMIAEVSGAAVLPFLDVSVQGTYVWFLMSFPMVLVAVFFSTLNWNHTVLYAPGDFKDEKNFLLLPRASTIELVQKAEVEVAAAEIDQAGDVLPFPAPIDLEHELPTSRDVAKYLALEARILDLVQLSFKEKIQRGVRVHVARKTGASKPIVLDGVIIQDKTTIAIEVVKVSGSQKLSTLKIEQTLRRFEEAMKVLPGFGPPVFKGIIAVVDADRHTRIHMNQYLEGIRPSINFDVQFQFFDDVGEGDA